MVQTILYVWLVLSSCVMERQFTEFRFLSGQYQKKGTTETNTNIKHQRISLRKLLKAAFFLKSRGMAKLSKKKKFLTYIFFFTMTTLQSRSFWTGWKLQRETATCVTPWSALFKKKKKLLAHFHYSDWVQE